jgi:pimeloyl-ACP methyl ester carboxylesterase
MSIALNRPDISPSTPPLLDCAPLEATDPNEPAYFPRSYIATQPERFLANGAYHTRTDLEVVGEHGSYRVAVTEPEFADRAHVIVRMQGILQATTDASERQVDTQLLHSFPGASIITLGNNGVHTKDTSDNATPAETAADRLRLLQALCPSETSTVTLVGTSLGAQTALNLKAINAIVGSPIHIDGVVYFAPGLAEPHKARQYIEQRFLGDLASSAVREASQQGLMGLWGLTMDAVGAGWNMFVTQSQAFNHQSEGLKRGTPAEVVRWIASKHAIYGIFPAHDGFKDGQPWQEILADTARHKAHHLEGKGHKVVLSAPEVIAALVPAIRHHKDKANGTATTLRLA